MDDPGARSTAVRATLRNDAPVVPTRTEVLLRGLAVSPGLVIGIARVVQAGQEASLRRLEPRRLREGEVEIELSRFDRALKDTRDQLVRLREDLLRQTNHQLAEIFDTHLLMLEDPMIAGETRRVVRDERRDAASAFQRQVEALRTRLTKIDNPYFQARGADLIDVAHRVLTNLAHAAIPQGPDGKPLPDPSQPNFECNEPAACEEGAEPGRVIWVAHDLLPSDLATMPSTTVAGFLTDKGGATSHTAILAKGLGIPAIVGLERATRRICNGDTLILDAMSGRVVVHPTLRTLERFVGFQHEAQLHEARLLGLLGQPAETLDGFRVDLAANIERPDDLRQMPRFGAKSVGLYRTEFLFLGKEPPTEDEQFLCYKQALDAVGPRHYVTFRTLDLGGDKHYDALPGYEEDNPFLGLRALRLTKRHPELLTPQLRALLRASAHGNARIMFPMVGGLEDFHWAKARVEEARDQLRREGHDIPAKVALGVMIEVPSAALMAEPLAREADFLSIGTNDLIQYTLAVDRGNDLVSTWYDPYHPAVWHLLSRIVEAAHRNGITVGVCGEMAGDPEPALLLLGLGMDELSMTPARMPRIKEAVRGLNLEVAHGVVRDILARSTSAEIRGVVQLSLGSRLSTHGPAPFDVEGIAVEA